MRLPVITLLDIGIQEVIVHGSQDGQIGEEPVGIKVIPPQGIGRVLPVDSRGLLNIVLLLKIIHAIVYTEKDPVIGINIVIQFHVKIGKVEIIDPRIKLLDGLW